MIGHAYFMHRSKSYNYDIIRDWRFDASSERVPEAVCRLDKTVLCLLPQTDGQKGRSLKQTGRSKPSRLRVENRSVNCGTNYKR